MKFKLSFQISLLCVAGALNSGVIMMTNAIIQAPPNILFCFELGFGFMLVFWLLRLMFKRMNTIARVALLVLTPLVMWRFGAFGALHDFFTAYANWFYLYNLAAPEPTHFGMVSSLVLVGIMSGVFSTCFVAVKPRVILTLSFYLAVIFAQYPYVDMPQFFIAVNIVMIALLMFIVLSEYARKAARYGPKLSATPYQVIGIPLCAIIILFSMRLPWSDTGNPNLIPSGLTDFVQSGGFSLFQVKYKLNETGRVKLGGGNRIGNELLFDLESDRPLYMYAECYDTYTGSTWGLSDGRTFPYTYQDYEALTGFFSLPIVPMEAVFFCAEYRNLSTDILLMPHLITEPFIHAANHQLLMTRGMVFRVEPGAGNGMSYEARAYTRKMGDILKSDLFLYDFIGGNYYDFYGNPDKLASAFVIGERRNATPYEFDPYALLQLPDTVTDRTRALAEEITADKHTFTEKALAIQDYLSTTYPYTLNAPPLPNGADFVDFFLFEAKRGYCTSYASAMTVMLRALGIPARYCEGFAPNVSSREDDVYHVYESDAHAWVEAFVPYIGWVEFDPTGSSNAGAYREDAIASPSPSPTPTPAHDVTPTSTPTPEPEFPPDDMPTFTPSATPSATPEQTFYKEVKVVLIRAVIVLAVALIPLGWIFGGRFYVKRKRRSVGRKSPNAQARFWYGRMQSLLKAEGLVIQDYETMREFVARVQEKLPSSGIDLLPAIALLEKTRYNNEDVAADELEAFRAAHSQLSSGLHAGWHPAKQWWETNVTWRLLW